MSRVLDAAKTAGRQAMFAGLQAAMIEIIELSMGLDSGAYGRLPSTKERMEYAESRVLAAIQRGDTYGSPAHLAELQEREASR